MAKSNFCRFPHSTKFRLIIFISLIILLIFVCESFILYYMVYSAIREEMTNTIIQDNDQAIKAIDQFFYSVKVTAEKPANEMGIINILRRPTMPTTTQKNEDNYHIQMFIFREIMLANNLFESVVLYNDHTEQYYAVSETYIIQNNKNYMDYSDITAGFDQITHEHPWRILGVQPSGLLVQPRSDYVVTCERGIFDANDQRLGVFCLNVKASAIGAVCTESKVSGYDNIYLLDQNNYVVYSNDAQAVGRPIGDGFDPLHGNRTGGSRTVDGSLQIASAVSSGSGWRVLTTSDIGQVFGYERTLTSIILLSFLILGVLEIVAVILVVSDMTHPISDIIGKLIRITNGDLNVVFKPSKGELGQVSEMLQMVVDKINSLIAEIYANEGKKRELELNALQAQITPHFIYNTLSRIQWMAILQHADGIADSLQAFSSILSYCISTSSYTITLGKELQFIRDYVNVMNLRMLTEVQMEYHIQPGLEGAQVLRFLLQPVVENVFVHAFDDSEFSCEMSIEAYVLEGTLVIRVKDNGVGLDGDKLEEIFTKRAKLDAPAHSIALVNIRDRIHLHYGPAYGLQITTPAGGGTLVQIELPYDRKITEEPQEEEKNE